MYSIFIFTSLWINKNAYKSIQQSINSVNTKSQHEQKEETIKKTLKCGNGNFVCIQRRQLEFFSDLRHYKPLK